jgi:hypothetical protein
MESKNIYRERHAKERVEERIGMRQSGSDFIW